MMDGRMIARGNRKRVSIRSYRFAVIGFGLLWCCGAVQAANIPAWWHTRGLVNTNLVANDYAPVNIGQLKNVAYQTWVEVTNQFGQVAVQVESRMLQVEGQTNLWNAAHITAANNESQIANLQSEMPNYVLKSGDTITGSLAIRSNLVVGIGTASGIFAVAEGSNTVASGDYSHAQGYNTTASGYASHAEGGHTTAASGEHSSHAEGWGTIASGSYSSHAEGWITTANGGCGSHAEGWHTLANGPRAHAEGQYTTASGDASHAEGNETTASAGGSHAEGESSVASGWVSHAEGEQTTARGSISHAEGYLTLAEGWASHAAGEYAQATHDNTYVWSDGTDISSTANAQYTVYAQNGIRLLGGPIIGDGSGLSNVTVSAFSGSISASQIADGTLSAERLPTTGTWNMANVTLTNVVLRIQPRGDILMFQATP